MYIFPLPEISLFYDVNKINGSVSKLVGTRLDPKYLQNCSCILSRTRAEFSYSVGTRIYLATVVVTWLMKYFINYSSLF